MTRVARIVLVAVAMLASIVPAPAQRRGDYLTEGELDLVRDIRRIDNRVEVFMRVAARRINALDGRLDDTLDTRFAKFGPLPKGSQIDLLDDYRRAVEELMVKFDDEYSRTGMTDDLRKGLEIAVPEIERQMKALDALRPKLTQEDAGHFVDKAIGVARELHDGAKAALDANPAPAKKK
jgi:hypothetical protein